MGDLRLSSPPYNMSICLTAIPVRCRRSQSPISKETPVYIREPQGKAEPTIQELETVILSGKAYTMGLLKCLKFLKMKKTVELINQ
ncbi:hypothetical protein H8356DRAFT_1341399 [Neocallimastix lanati (nom. inval.)]|nr:hypothetical protein H8356DRAFT_1341399 [Neocallimastix sp. JGI-2020a]